MKINFISYLDPLIHGGGGEQIARKIIESGQARGHSFSRTHINPPKNDYDTNADINILWDVYNCPEFGVEFHGDFVKFITSDKRYVYATGGYEDVCILGTAPCNGDTDGIYCKVSKNHPTFGPGGIPRPHPTVCKVKERSYIIKGASFCIFFSELQRDLIEKLIGSKLESFVTVPPVEHLDSYYNKGLKRDIKLLSYGGHLEYKGFFNIMEKYPTECPLFIGGGPQDLPLKYSYGKCLGKIPQEDMPSLLNRVEKFVHMPRWAEPYGLTTVQAALCGCEVIENENSKVLSKGLDSALREITKSRDCKGIWESIEHYEYK